jgi:hypothetical protein
VAGKTKDAQKSARGKPFQKGDPRINAGGRPRTPEEVREMWRAATPKATKRLIEALDAERTIISGGRDTPIEIEYVPDWDVRLKAIEILYSRQWGKPVQAIADPDGNAIPIGIMVLPSEKLE